jgi:hypothetical protein
VEVVVRRAESGRGELLSTRRQAPCNVPRLASLVPNGGTPLPPLSHLLSCFFSRLWIQAGGRGLAVGWRCSDQVSEAGSVAIRS